MVPGSLVAVILGVVAVKLFDLDAKGVEIVGPIDSGLPRIGLPEGRSFSRLPHAPPAAAAGIMLVGFAEGLGAAKTYAARAHYEVDPNRELIGLGAANIGSGLMTGMVVNGSLSKTAVNGSAGARSQVSGLVVAVVHRRDAAVPHRPVRGPPRGDAGRGRDRRRRRARRHRRPARLLPPLHPPPRAASTAAPPDPTSSPPSPRCSACSSSTPCPGWSSASSCRCCCCCTGRLGPHVAELGRVPGRARPVRRCRPPPGEPGGARRGRAARRVGPVLRQRRGGAAGDPGSAPIGPASSASCSTPRRWRSWTSPPCGCSRSSPTTSPAAASSSCSPTTSARSATCWPSEGASQVAVHRTIDEAIAAVAPGAGSAGRADVTDCCSPGRPPSGPSAAGDGGGTSSGAAPDLLDIPGGSFRMGRSGRWPTPATARRRSTWSSCRRTGSPPTRSPTTSSPRSSTATGHVSDAERFGWSFVFAGHLPDDFPPTRAVAQTPWWRQVHGADWAASRRPAIGPRRPRAPPRRPRVVGRRRRRTARGRAPGCRPRPSGSTPHAAAGAGPRSRGATSSSPAGARR